MPMIFLRLAGKHRRVGPDDALVDRITGQVGDATIPAPSNSVPARPKARDAEIWGLALEDSLEFGVCGLEFRLVRPVLQQFLHGNTW